jgi:hypothetical protein
MLRKEKRMQVFRFAVAVALTSLGLVAVLVLGGGLLVRSALAFGPWSQGGFGPPWAGGHNGWAAAVPSQLSGLHDLPAAERFSHFKSAQVTLTDRDNQPVAMRITPGTATSLEGSTLTVAPNEGPSRAFNLDAQTLISGRRAYGGAQAGNPTINPGDKLVVVTLNESTTATAVWSVDPDHLGHRGPFRS